MKRFTAANVATNLLDTDLDDSFEQIKKPKKREMRRKQVSWRKKGLSRTCPQIEVQLLQYVGTRLDCGPEKESPSGSWE